MARKLKVFRMAVGFDDAYVAAPSRKAALAAWGSEHDQFARGVAEEVTDPALTQEPLAHPGEVIRKSRGDLASQLKVKPAKRQKAEESVPERVERPAPKPPRKPVKPKPPPKRNKIDAAEAALDEARRRYEVAIAGLEDEREAIEAKLQALRTKQDKELAKLARTRDEEREAYRAALDKWSDG